MSDRGAPTGSIAAGWTDGMSPRSAAATSDSAMLAPSTLTSSFSPTRRANTHNEPRRTTLVRPIPAGVTKRMTSSRSGRCNA
jgi:hypothetical protein